MLLGEGDEIGQVVTLALAVYEIRGRGESRFRERLEHRRLRFDARRHCAAKGVDERRGE